VFGEINNAKAPLSKLFGEMVLFFDVSLIAVDEHGGVAASTFSTRIA
jgi:citrate synthase